MVFYLYFFEEGYFFNERFRYRYRQKYLSMPISANRLHEPNRRAGCVSCQRPKFE